MALRVPALPFTFVVHALGISLLVLVLVWTIDFRGGFAWESTNKSLIFNVSPTFSLSLSPDSCWSCFYHNSFPQFPFGFYCLWLLICSCRVCLW
jgi:hypothetical protein